MLEILKYIEKPPTCLRTATNILFLYVEGMLRWLHYKTRAASKVEMHSAVQNTICAEVWDYETVGLWSDLVRQEGAGVKSMKQSGS